MLNQIPMFFPSLPSIFGTCFGNFRDAYIKKQPLMNNIIPTVNETTNNQGLPQPCNPIIPTYAHIVPKNAINRTPTAVPRTSSFETVFNVCAILENILSSKVLTLFYKILTFLIILFCSMDYNGANLLYRSYKS